MIDTQILAVGVVTMLAVISPGPDFAVILRNSIAFGRLCGFLTAMGIASGVLVHISYTLLGFGFVMREAVWVLEVMRYLGAAYLIWLGVSAFLPPKKSDDEDIEAAGKLPLRKAFTDGFICNALNPKTALFFIALFSQVVDPKASVGLQVGIGGFIAVAHLVWFGLVAYFMTHGAFKNLLLRLKNKIEKAIGLCLFGLGLKLILTRS